MRKEEKYKKRKKKIVRVERKSYEGDVIDGYLAL